MCALPPALQHEHREHYLPAHKALDGIVPWSDSIRVLILGGAATQAALRIKGAGGSRTQISWCARCSWRCLGAGLIWRRARPLTSTASLARWPLYNTSLHTFCISFVLSVLHTLLCKSRRRLLLQGIAGGMLMRRPKSGCAS